MRSPTQPAVSRADIAALVATHLGTGVRSAAELTGGGFATVWRAELDDGREVAVKVGPPPQARLLAYEKGLLPAEAEYFRLVRAQSPGVPVPEVLAGCADWLISTLLPGRPLTAGD